MADQHISGSDTESIVGASEGETPVVEVPDTSIPVFLCLHQSSDEG